MATIIYSYDRKGQLTCVDNGAGAQRGYTYDQVGNLTAITSTCTPGGAAAVNSAETLNTESQNQPNAAANSGTTNGTTGAQQ